MSGQIPKTMFHATDTRYNFSELPPQLLGPDIRSRMEQQAQSVACLVDKGLLIEPLSQGAPYHINSTAPTLANKLQSMAEEAMREHSSEEKRPPVQEETRLKYDGPFKDELSLAKATVFLVGNQLVLTAAHCVCDYISGTVNKAKITSLRVLFGFQTDSSGQIRTTFDAKDVYRIESVWQHRLTREKPGEPPIADWAILKLEREVKGRVPLSLDSMQALSLNTSLYMLGHPSGLPLKLTLSGQVQKTSHPHLFDTDLDAYGGNSGSPVFAHDTGRMVGMLLRGNENYALDGNNIRIRAISKRMIEDGEAGYEKCHKIASIDFLKTVLTSSFKMAYSHFSGRIKHLADLKAHLTAPSPSTRVQILYGPSGVGKSELATAFANQNIEAFSFIWTISCGTEEEQYHGYQSLAARLGIPLEEKEDLPSLINKVHRMLEQNTSKPWLLVFDNLQKIPVLPSRGGSVIITSYRNLGIPQGAVVATEILSLEPDEALKLLQDATGKPIEDCQKLLGRIGSYPLLLGQAAAYIKQTRMEVAEYLANFEQSLSLEAAFGMTLKRLSPLAREWLFLCSRLNAALIPLSYLKAWLNLESRSEDLTAIIEELEAYGLLRYNPKEEVFSLHLEFQRTLQSLASSNTATQAASLLTIVAKDFESKNTHNWSKSMHMATIWASHAKFLIESSHQVLLDDLEKASLLDTLGHWEYEKAQYGKALECYSAALKLGKACLGWDHPDIASSLNNIGVCYHTQGNYDKALRMHSEALQISRTALGENHHEVARCLNNIGNCYCSQKNHNKGLKMYEEALLIERATLEKNHLDIATSLNNIGLCYLSQETYSEALSKLTEALKIKRAALGENHPEVARSLSNLGNCYLAQRNSNGALQTFDKALKIQRATLGENHPDIAQSLYNIGLCFCFQANYNVAREMLGDALKIQRAILEKNHPIIAKNVYFIGDCYYFQGNYREALKMYEEAHLIQLARENHSEVANILSKIRSCEKRLDQEPSTPQHNNRQCVVS